ncbi:MAG: nuclear transport factor 2 family protein [Calditrichota bacterium]
MKTRQVLIILFALSSILFAQSEKEAIRKAINGYIVGTSYNYPDSVLSSFLPGANMFLDYKDSPLYIMKIEEYAGRIAKQERGRFNGRVSNVLSIDQFGGIASVKLEVLIPSIKKRFIDFLLVKKLEKGWKIISKTAASEFSERTGKKVLLILSSADKQGSSDLPAGNSFSEVAIAWDLYQKAGYHVEILTPQGGRAPLAYINPADDLHLNYLYYSDFMYALNHTLSPSQVNANEYDIVQFTGGSAPIFDVPENEDIQKIVMHVYEKNNGVIAAVCHGSAGLVNLKKSNGSYLVKGKSVCGFPDAHERKDLPHYKQYPFIIETVLEERGGLFRYSEKAGTPHMEVDGRLVTGQNWQSSEMVTKKSIEIAQR